MADETKIIDMTLFEALQDIDIDQLEGEELTDVLPFLVKLLLNPSFIKRQKLLKLLYPIKKTNDVIQLFTSRNLETFETNVPPTSAFESSPHSDRLRIVASEYMRIQERARLANFAQTQTNLKLSPSDLFDNHIYVDDISHCLCMLLLKPTNNPVMNILDMSEALLHVQHGPTYIVRIVANMPDRCQEVCQSLVTYGEKLDEGASFNEVSEQRAKTLGLLCQMNPSIAFTVRSATLQMCKMPSLTIMITLDYLDKALQCYDDLLNDKPTDSDNSNTPMEVDDPEKLIRVYSDLENTYDNAIAFITGLLLGIDEATRVWFATYTKSAQQKRIDHNHYSVLSKFRSQILACINRLFPVLLEEEYIGSDHSNDTGSPRETKTSESIKSRTTPREMSKTLIRATATLRLFCALKGIGSLKLNQEESEIILRLITCKPSVNQISVNFATTGVCTLLACPTLINNPKEERRAAEWLKWLIKESDYSNNRYSSHGKCSISQLLLLIAIHFQNNQNNAIAELVCATLGMKLTIKTAVSKCKSLFVQEVFTDQMVAEHAVKVPVTKNLNNGISEFLPVHCIHHLLESRSFSKHQVPIKDWIYHQICESMKPIHNILPKLIEAYVNSVIISTSVHGHCGTNQPLSEEEISRVFSIQLYSVKNPEDISVSGNGYADESRPLKKIKQEKDGNCDNMNLTSNEPNIVDLEAAQVLLLYYLVLYEDVRLKKSPDLSTAERTKLIRYNPDFMMEIPVFYLLQLVRDNQDSFSAILPYIMKLVTAQYPQLCSIQHWLNTELYEPHKLDSNGLESKTSELLSAQLGLSAKSPSKSTAIKTNLMKQLSTCFQNIEKDILPLTKTINLVLLLPRQEIWPLVDIFVENLPKIMKLKISDEPIYKRLVQVTAKLWWKFNTIFPRKLWVMTVNVLKRSQNNKLSCDVKPVEYTWDELALDPLIVLRCDNRVFRCKETLYITLHILSAFLAASKRCLQNQLNEQPNRQKDIRGLEELKASLILAQTSAAIQILLESCIPTYEEQEALDKRKNSEDLSEDEKILLERFDASVDCICEHLHQVFIADTNLAKLVHFQTYPSELLSTTSDRIPSMHICLDFIPELLSQPDLSKQIFVIELTSHLCEKYAITKSLNVCKLCFNVAFTLLQVLPSERRALFFIPVLPALIRICKVFPILRDDADIIVNQINQVTLSHMASAPSRLSLCSSKPFEGLDKMAWREVRKLMNSLSLNEALYLCIQRCTVDLNELKEKYKQNLVVVEQPSIPVYNTIFAYGNHVINPTGG